MNETVNTVTIWVVDDEPGMCRGAVRTLGGWTDSFSDLGEKIVCNVLSMGSGEEFLERIATEQPQILLLDGKLPGIDGIGVLEQLHKRGISLVTIMITAYATLDKAVEATKLGAYDFLAKPFTPEELRYAVHKAARNVILTRKARRLEEEQRKVRFNFISVLAHELKSPLGAIEGYVNLIRTRQAGETLADYDHMIERVGVRINGMRKLIGDLLDLTRIEAQTGRRELATLDLRTVAESSAELQKEAAAQRGISIHLKLGSELFMTADSSEMEMLFNNLLSNAVKYNRDDGNVTLSGVKSGKHVRLICADTGIGMTAEECKRLFREFSRIKNEKTRSIPGSGLGLSIVNKIVTLYHGSITVSSIPDEGTTFTVELEDRNLNDSDGSPSDAA
ncbi:MAG: response regulator [Chitinispirillaceae bacterium]|nr:response regulator [Chitinispirillaceae bacterium]